MAQLTGSEALYGFMGWLSSRGESVTFSASHDAGKAANLVKQFCDTNNLTEPRDNWTEHLTHPVEETE